MARHWRHLVWLIAMAAASYPAAAEPKKPPAKVQQQPNPQQAQPGPTAQQGQGPALPDAYKLNLLIRSSIIALNQANQTGNYTVLQDLGAPAFRASNNSARLAQIFAALRQRQLDLSPVLFFTPKLIVQPQIGPNGLLRLAGYFPTTPERVNFDLIYQQVAGEWRMFGIGVSTSPAEVTSAMPQSGGGQAPGAPAAKAAQTAPGNAAPREERAASSKAAQKADTAPRPNRRPQAENLSANSTTETVQNGATNNAARIDLASPKAAGASEPPQDAVSPEPADGSPKEEPGFWDSLNPFGPNN